MHTKRSKQHHAQTTEPSVAEALLQYFSDCKFEASDLNPMNVALALEYVYQPVPGFWRELTVDLILDVIATLLSLDGARSALPPSRLQQLTEELAGLLHLNSFDEANAERLMNLPTHLRPRDAESATAWLCTEFARQGLAGELEFAQRDGDQQGERALEALSSQQAAQRGVVVERVGTSVARFYRNAAMAGSPSQPVVS